jgi:hypothetical protein
MLWNCFGNWMKFLNRDMTEFEIINIVKGYISDSLAGLSKENPKLDFKAKWYDLKQEEAINEFIKDSSSIANTPGLDGFIVIGFDDGSNTFMDSVFSDSNLKDSNELVGMLIKKVDRNYHLASYDIMIDGHKLSVLHIPPSFDKPHVIKNYRYKSGKIEEHRVFIRNGTSTRIATKYDLDFIAYDRKNNIPEYALYVSTSKISISPRLSTTHDVDLNIGLIIENNGLRPVAITEIILTFYYSDSTLSYISRTNKEEILNTIISVSNLIIQPALIRNFSGLVFSCQQKMTETEFNQYAKKYNEFDSLAAKIKLNNGKIIETKIQII